MRVIFCLILGAMAAAAQLVTIADTIRRSDNTTPSGTMTIVLRNPCTAPSTPGGTATIAVSTNQITVTVTNGAFSVNLYATRTCIPAGAYYEVRYNMDDGIDRDVPKYWTFDYSASALTLATIQSTLRPNQNTVLLAQLANAQGNSGKVVCSDGANWLACNAFADITTTRGDMIYRGASALARLAIGTNGQCLASNGTDPVWSSTCGGGGAGTVTSVGLSAPGFLSVAGSPITTSGTLALSLANQNANLVFAGPSSGGATTPTFRSLVAADIPSLGYVAPARAINTTAPLAGGGDLSADRTISLSLATGGFLGTTGGLGLIRTCSTNQIPKWDGSQWACAADETGAGGSGITTLNTLTGSTQSFATGTAGTDFAISSSGSTHTFNFPSASGSNRGLLTSADWSTFNGKVGAHAMLSSAHTDATAGAVARGDLIAGIGASPTWQRVAAGAQGRFLRMNSAAQEPEWGTMMLSHAASDPPTVSSITAAQTAASHAGGTDFVEVRGNMLYMVLLDATNSGVEVWDISRIGSGQPRHMGALTMTGFPFCAFLTVAHPYMYVACQSNKVAVVNISNPAALSVVATITTTQADNQRMRVVGNRLIVGSGGGVEIYDVTTPTAAKLVFQSTTIGGKNFAVQGDFAYFINNSFGSGGTLSILNMRTLSQAGTVAIGTTIGIAPNAIAVDGAYLYLAGGTTGGKLRTYDISNPASPAQVGSDLTVDAASFAHMWLANGRYLYVNSDKTSGQLHVIDISTPGSASLINSITLGNRPDNMAVSGCQIFIANYTDETLSAIRLPNCIDAPGADIGNLRSTTVNVSQDAVINGQVRTNGVVVGTDGIGSAGIITSGTGALAPLFTIHSATAPGSPASGQVHVYSDAGDSGKIKQKTSTGTVNPFALTSGSFATNDCLKMDSNGVIVTNGAACYSEPTAIDFTSKTSTAPNKAGTSLPGTCAVGATYLKTDATAAAMLYICTATNTWTQQVGTGSGSPGGSSTQIQYNSSGSFAGSATATLTATASSLVSQAVNTGSGGRQPLGIAIHGRILYVTVADASTAANNFLEAWDISVRGTPAFLGSVTTNARNATFLEVSGGYAYVTNTTEGTISIIKITNPAAMSVVGTVTLANAQQVRVRGKWMFVGMNATTLPIYDISDPANARQVANLASAGGKNIAIDDRYVYAVNNAGNTMIITDTENPASPVVRSTTALGTDVATIVNAIAVSGRRAFLGGTVSSPKLAVYNISNPASPVLLDNSIAQDFGTVPNFIVSGNYLIAAQDATSANVRIYDISAVVPSLLTTTSAGNRAASIAVSGEAIAVTNAGTTTFSILQQPFVALQSAKVGSIEVEQLRALGETRIEGRLVASSGASIGPHGLRSDGALAALTEVTAPVFDLTPRSDPGDPGAGRKRIFADSGNSNKLSVRDSSGTMPFAFISGSYATNDCAKFDASGNIVSAGAACGTGGGSWPDPGANGIVVRLGSNSTINRTITGTSGRVSVTNGDGVSANPTIDIDTNVAMRNAANTFSAGAKLSVQQDGTNAGLRIVPSSSGTPASINDGDIWLNSTTNQIGARINGSTVRLATATGSTTTNNCVKFDSAGNVVDAGAACGGGGGGTINSGAGKGFWLPYGASSYSPSGAAISPTTAGRGYRHQRIVPAQIESRNIKFNVSTASGTSCTGGTCGLQAAIYTHDRTSQVAVSEVGTSGNATSHKDINSTAAGKSLAWSSGSSVSSGVLTLAAGAYWLVIASDSTAVQVSTYGANVTAVVIDAGDSSTIRIGLSSAAISSGNGASFALNSDISGSSFALNASTVLPVVALTN